MCLDPPGHAPVFKVIHTALLSQKHPSWVIAFSYHWPSSLTGFFKFLHLSFRSFSVETEIRLEPSLLLFQNHPLLDVWLCALGGSVGILQGLWPLAYRWVWSVGGRLEVKVMRSEDVFPRIPSYLPAVSGFFCLPKGTLVSWHPPKLLTCDFRPRCGNGSLPCWVLTKH